MGEIKRLLGKHVSIDEQIAEHQKNMAQYRDPPDEFDDLVVTIYCVHCEHKGAQTIRWLRNRDDLLGFLRFCPSCGRKRKLTEDDFIERLIEDFKKQGQQGLKLHL